MLKTSLLITLNISVFRHLVFACGGVVGGPIATGSSGLDSHRLPFHVYSSKKDGL